LLVRVTCIKLKSSSVTLTCPVHHRRYQTSVPRGRGWSQLMHRSSIDEREVCLWHISKSSVFPLKDTCVDKGTHFFSYGVSSASSMELAFGVYGTTFMRQQFYGSYGRLSGSTSTHRLSGTIRKHITSARSATPIHTM
jgi:hypothetical protein